MFIADMLRKLFLLTFLIFTAWSDVCTGKIRNKTLFRGFASAGIFNCFFVPAVSPEALAQAAAVTLVLLILRRYRLIGGGDIKLLMLPVWVFPDRTGVLVMLLSFPAAALLWLWPALYRKSGKLPFAVCVFMSAAVVFSGGFI